MDRRCARPQLFVPASRLAGSPGAPPVHGGRAMAAWAWDGQNPLGRPHLTTALFGAIVDPS